MKVYISWSAVETRNRIETMAQILSKHTNISYFDVIYYSRLPTKRVYCDFYKALNGNVFDRMRLTRTKRAGEIVLVSREIVSDMHTLLRYLEIETNLDIGILFKYHNMGWYINKPFIFEVTKMIVKNNFVYYMNNQEMIGYEPFLYLDSQFRS